MPRLDPATRNIVIGRLQAGQSQNEVARTVNVDQSTIFRLWNRFQQAGSSNDRPRSGRLRKTTPGKDRYIRSFIYIIEPFPHQPLQSEYLDCEEWAHKQSATDFDSMVLDQEGHISERYWRRYTDMKESVGATD
jgi:hypothetical protein